MNASLPAPLDVKLMNLTASVLFAGLVLAVLAVAARWAVHHPAFAIRRIVVQGEMVHNNAITLRANVAPQLVGNFFTIDLAQVRDAFEQVPWVRSASVRREYPGTLRVRLREHDAAAYWGPETSATLLNGDGETFEANASDLEQDDLPRLKGPQGQSAVVLDMFRRLQPVFAPLALELTELEWTPRGGWRATFDSNAVVELGGGTTAEVLERSQKFVQTLNEVVGQYRRRVDALEAADLRHADGYALRLRGVTTLAPDAARANAAQPQRR